MAALSVSKHSRHQQTQGKKSYFLAELVWSGCHKFSQISSSLRVNNDARGGGGQGNVGEGHNKEDRRPLNIRDSIRLKGRRIVCWRS